MLRSSVRRYAHCTVLFSLLAAAGCSSQDAPADGAAGAQAQAGSTANVGGSSPNGGAGAGQTAGGSSTDAGMSNGGAPIAGSGNGGAGGVGVTAGTGGSAGGTPVAGAGPAGGAGGGASDPGYTSPPRDINITRSGLVTTNFTPADAAPGATSFHGGAQQQARFNADAPKVQKKLVIGLGGVGTGPHNGGGLAWATDRGYHTIGLDYYNASGGDQGNNYRASWSGENVGDANVGPMNSIMNRVKTGLSYLQQKDPGADWAYYLDAQGNVRWNDVIVFGYSFGAQTGAAGTKYVALHRLVATSGPGISDTAAWVSELPNKTPGTRSFTISGIDDGGHKNHMATATRLGWPGQEVNTSAAKPPYGDSHLLAVAFGHSEFCSLPTNVLANADEVCEHAFGYTK